MIIGPILQFKTVCKTEARTCAVSINIRVVLTITSRRASQGKLDKFRRNDFCYFRHKNKSTRKVYCTGVIHVYFVVRICLEPWLWWRYHGWMHTSKFIKTCTLNVCNVLYISCTSVKLKKTYSFLNQTRNANVDRQ